MEWRCSNSGKGLRKMGGAIKRGPGLHGLPECWVILGTGWGLGKFLGYYTNANASLKGPAEVCFAIKKPFSSSRPTRILWHRNFVSWVTRRPDRTSATAPFTCTMLRPIGCGDRILTHPMPLRWHAHH